MFNLRIRLFASWMAQQSLLQFAEGNQTLAQELALEGNNDLAMGKTVM